jgi:hypothetical protein
VLNSHVPRYGLLTTTTKPTRILATSIHPAIALSSPPLKAIQSTPRPRSVPTSHLALADEFVRAFMSHNGVCSLPSLECFGAFNFRAARTHLET